MKIPYIVKLAVSGQKFSSRPVFGPNWTQPELDPLISAATGVPPAKCAQIGRLYFLTLLHALLPRRIFDLFGLLRVEPTTGGTAATVDGFRTASDLQTSSPHPGPAAPQRRPTGPGGTQRPFRPLETLAPAPASRPHATRTASFPRHGHFMAAS